MNIHFSLKDGRLKESPLRLIVTHRGKVYRKGIGITVESASWSRKKERSGFVKVDERLKEIRHYLENHLDQFSTDEAVRYAIDKAVKGEPDKVEAPVQRRITPTFTEAMNEWGTRPSPSMKQHKLAAKRVYEMMGRCDWTDITPEWFRRLTNIMEERGYGVNYQGNIIKGVKYVMGEGLELGYHKNLSFKRAKTPHGETDAICLTEAEMEKIWGFQSDLLIERQSRDLAWLGYLTCARFSDYSRLSEANIGSDGKIRFTQQKTSKSVVLPCSPRVREILARNGGKAPQIAHQTFNRVIKDVCCALEIADLVEIVKIEGRDRVRMTFCKYELVSSHTFRRSAATNLYLKGVPLVSIMKLTGHSSIAVLERYLKVTGEETADTLADNDFFK